jgi:hypothetical protein
MKSTLLLGSIVMLSLAFPWLLLFVASPAAPFLNSLGATADSYRAFTVASTKLTFYIVVMASALIAANRSPRFKLLAALAGAIAGGTIWFLAETPISRLP